MKNHQSRYLQFAKLLGLIFTLFLGLQSLFAQAQPEPELTPNTKRDLLQKLTAEINQLLAETKSSTSPEIFQTALNKATQGIEVSREIKSPGYEALFTLHMARIFAEQGDHQKTLEHYEKSLKIINSDKATKAKLKFAEVTVLRSMGRFYQNEMEDSLEAGKLYTRALSLYQENEEDANKGLLFRDLGDVINSYRFHAEAEQDYLEAVGIFRRLKLPLEEGVTLGKLGIACFNQKGKSAEALKYLLASEKLLESSPDNSEYQNVRVYYLGYLYLLYDRLNAREEAAFYRNKAREVRAKTTDPFVQFSSTFLLGNALKDARQFEDALKIYQDALELATNSRMLEKASAQTAALKQITLLYLRLDKVEEAQKSFDKAFDLTKEIKDHTELADLVESFADKLFEGQAFKLAQDYYDLALSILRSEKNRPVQVDPERFAGVLSKSGKSQLRNGNQSAALTDLRTALTVQMSLYKESNLADMLHDRMTVFAGLNQRRLAIFFGKQAVALKQEIRRTLKSFPVETQKSFLKGTRKTYETLASLLIQENRIGEALQIMNLYQSQEFFDFGDNLKVQSNRLSFTQYEKSVLAELQNLQARLRESKEHFRLNPNFRRLEDLLKQIEVNFSKAPGEKDKAPIVPEVTEMQTVLGELNAATGQKSATIYTLIAKEKFYVLLLTSEGEIKVFKSSVTADTLNSKILRFYALLQSPTYDPKQLGKELHDIILRPVEAELKRQNIQTLMWQLDGSLRYVPVAALWDGKTYLVERFRNVMFTRLDRERMTRGVSRSWTGTGFGSSQEHTVDLPGEGDPIRLPALPGVAEELQRIFRVRGVDPGIMDGEVFADAKFTKNAFFDAMKQRRPLVHVSSHFSFRPGDGRRSFMLLGDGTALTLDEMKDREGLFDGVELLTLSACNTAATQSDAYGKEIDGFAELAQRLGAGSVMATLWQVSDESTPWLMKEFYTIRQSNGGTTKAEALRNAQLALLKGTADTRVFSETHKGGGTSNIKVVVVSETSNQTNNLTRADIVYVSEMEASLFKIEDQNKFAHPYYWAPFILIGNWR